MRETTHSSKASVLGPGQIKDVTVPLYPVDGETITLKDFVQANHSRLSPPEQALIKQYLNSLAPNDANSENLVQCLGMKAQTQTLKPAMQATKCGERSVLLPEQMIQLKGCLPGRSDESFPIEILGFDDDSIQRSTIPFGTMTEESVLREILGNCFMEAHGLRKHISPLSVWRYLRNGDTTGYCLVSKYCSQQRIEDFLEPTRCTVGDIVRWQNGEVSPADDLAVGSEIRLQGMNLWPFVEAKSRLLSKMHFKGGFRGVLNSNFGNDVVLSGASEPLELALCDFDTFFMVDIPESPDQAFMERFALHCLVEAIMGSLPILSHVQLPDNCSPEDRADALGEIYFSKSSLWRSYRRQLFAEAKTLGWDLSLFGQTLEKMRRTPACADVLSTRVLSNQYFASLGRERNVYFPHGPVGDIKES